MGTINLRESPACADFDDVLHRALGLAGHDWQSLYHFTIGDPVEDLRLRTAPPYAHLANKHVDASHVAPEL